MLDKEIAPIFITVASVAWILNLVESVLIIRMRKTWKPFEKILLSLSFADQLVAIVTIVSCVMVLHDVKLTSDEDGVGYFIFLLLSSEDFSLLHILAITLDRFLAIKQPIKHHIRMQGRLPSIMIAVIWVAVTAFIAAVWAVAIIDTAPLPILLKFYSAVMILIGILYVFTYKHMFLTVLIRSAKAHNVARCPIRQVLQNYSCKKERTLFMTCCLVLLSYIICMYPISIEILLRSRVTDLSAPSQMLLLSNSILNPMVYFYKGLCDRRVRNAESEDGGRNSGQSKSITFGHNRPATESK